VIETQQPPLARPTEAFPVEPDPNSWGSLLIAYREGPRQVYAPVILGLLEGQIAATAQRLRPPVPGLTAEDIRQKLVLRVLEASLEMPLAPDPLWIPRCLMLRARTGVGRWLAAELREGSLAALARDTWGRAVNSTRPKPTLNPRKTHAFGAQNQASRCGLNQ
jgi:hypothetical protein